MAEDSPFPSSETSPLSQKRRITDTEESPSLTLSSLPSELKPPILELGPTETQKTQSSPEQSPKKPKFCSLNQSLSDEGCSITDDFLKSSTKRSILDGETDSQVSEVFNEVKQFDSKDEFSQLEGYERKDEFLGDKDENPTESSSENLSENAVSEIVEVGFEKEGGNLNGFLHKFVKDEDSAKSLKIEMIDGTLVLGVDVAAVVDNVPLVEGKRNRRRAKKGNPRKTGLVAGDSSGGRRRFVYSMKDLEVMRYVNMKGQRKFWYEVYNGFSATVKQEYDELGSFKSHQTGAGKRNCNNGGIVGVSCSTIPSYHHQGILGESCSGNVSCDTEIISSSNFTCEDDYSGKDGDDLVGEWSEDEESDDEYESIHRPAFKVEGEPDFESGPPEDGLEYLRRVRWEAKQIPKVKVAKLNNIKVKDQSVYMPEIPDIEECPPHLVPLRPWEDEFIADFSNLRLALSHLEDTSDAVSVNSESVIFARPECKGHPSGNLASLQLTSGAPTLSSVLAMDPVTRVTTLRRRVSLFESASDFSKDDCAWLFALCAVIETPLDADTSASLRCLLRRCAKLRAGKAEVDDEVIMLNVLATISGRFFGQSGN